MEQEKIGRFIAECRKSKNLTQVQLAEKLNITDRAISKWETGKGMPDSSIMLNLCQELGISVNELLSGERIEKNEYDKKTEILLLELSKKEEEQNKRLLYAEIVIISISVIFLLAIALISEYFVKDDFLIGIIMSISVIVVLIICIFALKLESSIGYYECKKCKHRYAADFKDVFWSMHMGTTRYLKCPKCGEKSWNKKVFSR